MSRATRPHPSAARRPLRRPGLALALAAAALIALPAAGPLRAEPAAVVKATDTLKFTPGRITIEAGETVKWVNASVLVHTVTADPEKVADPAHVALPEGAAPFDSGNLEPQATFTHTFSEPGLYRYFCIPHEAANMVGEVRVK